MMAIHLKISNADLRAFLVCILSDSYEELQAANGKHGLEIAERDMPDFIITDVMMPEMNGLEMVHLIKQNTDICHIPIIVLSAKASLSVSCESLRNNCFGEFGPVYLLGSFNGYLQFQ